MRDLFIADAHLRHPEDRNYRALLSFLESQSGHIRTLYLLGDLFEFWLGFKHVVYSDHIPILHRLSELHAKGTQIVYVEGNHDFNLGPFFKDTLNCTVFPDGGDVEIDGHKVFLGHGDLADPSDKGYRLLRSIFRSRVVRFLSGIVHPDAIWRFAAWASRNSTGKQRRRDLADCRAILLPYANQLFSKGYEFVITGHYHTPFTEQSENGTLIALGDWIDQFSYAVYEDGQFRLEQFDTGSITD